MSKSAWMWLAKAGVFAVGVALGVTHHLSPELAVLLGGAQGALGVRGGAADIAVATKAAGDVTGTGKVPTLQ